MSKRSDRAGGLPAFYRPVTGLLLGLASAGLMAGDKPTVPYDVAEVFIELNNSDKDLGLHALIDGTAWKKLEIIDPNGKRYLKTQLSGKLKEQGLTEFFYESAEPVFEDLSPEEFFERFPEGMYKVKGKSLEGEKLESMTLFTHAVPAPPVTYLNDDSDTATECDEDETGYDPLSLTRPVTISWAPVEHSRTGGGFPVEMPVTIHNYEVVVEIELETEEGEEFDSVFSVILPPGETSMTVPEEFMDQADGFVKYEVLAREVSFNQTALESCFLVEGDAEEEEGEEDEEEDE